MRIALDLSCAAESPLTGIGYAAVYQINALAKLVPRDTLSAVAAGGRDAQALMHERFPGIADQHVYPRARLLKYYAWTRLNWPPIERLCGPVNIAHNLCHALPPTQNARTAVTVHDLSTYRHPETHTQRTVQVQRRLLEQTAEKAHRMIAVSEFTKQELVDRLKVSPGRIEVVPNGVAIAEFENEMDEAWFQKLKQRIGLRDRYIMYLGTIEPRKNVTGLVDAYATLRETDRNCPQLLIAGTPGWNAAESLEAISNATRNGDIIQTGYLNRDEAVALLRNADALVYPSIYEGFGLPVLEAMAARTPVVASDIPPIREVTDGAATLAPLNDAGALAEAMSVALKDDAPIQAKVRTAYARAQTLSWEASAEKLLTCYRDMMTHN